MKYKIKLNDRIKINVDMLSPYQKQKLAKTSTDPEVIADLYTKVKGNSIRNILEARTDLYDLLSSIDKPDKIIAGKVCNMPQVTEDYFMKLINQDAEKYLGPIEYSPYVTTKVLDKLFKETEDNYVLSKMLEREDCPYHYLVDYYNVDFHNIRWAIAENKNTPLNILQILAKDEDEAVCSHARNNPKFRRWVESLPEEQQLEHLTPKELEDYARTTDNVKDIYKLYELYKSDKGLSYEVIRGLLSNENAPYDIIFEIINEWGYTTYLNKFIFDNRNNISVLVDLYNYLTDKNLKSILANYLANKPKVPSDVLRDIYNEFEEYEIIHKLASNPNTPIDVLQKIWEDADRWDLLKLKGILNKNPNFANVNKIDYIVSNYSPDRAKTIIKLFSNPRTTIADREKLLNLILDNLEDFDENILYTIIASGNRRLINIIRNHPNTPDDVFEEI